jgi:3-oxoadipate enol-lactonase
MLKHLHANGIEIAYRIDGDRSPYRPWLVFSHSLACDHTMWNPQVDAFKRACNVLCYDTRGHGGTSAPAGDYTLDLLADDLRALLDALRIDHCHFVGLSLGGMIGQVAALRMPMRIASLTLADTSSRTPPEMKPVWAERVASVKGAAGVGAVAAATLERWFTAGYRVAHADVIKHIEGLIRATPVNGYVGCAHAIAGLNLTDRLRDIRCPVLVIVGAEDPGTPPAMAETIVQAIEHARYQKIAAAAHLSNIEQPEAFNAALRAFLTALDWAGPQR